jgi:Zn-dependent protease with chaperone function
MNSALQILALPFWLAARTCGDKLISGLNTNNQGFEASLFHPDFGNEVVPGRVFIDRQKLRFVSESVTEEIPANEVVVTIDEDGERVFFTTASRPDLKIFTPDPSVLNHPSARQCEPIWSQVVTTVRRRDVSRRLRLTAYFIATCIIITLTGSWVMSALVRSAVKQVPPEWEKKFGDKEMAEVQRRFHFDDDTNRVARLAADATPLIQVLPPDMRNLKFYIVEEESPNAFALPGGQVVVTEGLLELVDADRPEQLLGVLAHELAHVTQRHHVRKLLSAAGPAALFGVLFHSRSGAMNVLSIGSGLLVVQGFSKEYEEEADLVGWDYLVAAGIDPRGMIETFQKLRSYESNRNAIVLRLPEAFASHPALDKRIAYLEQKAKKLQATVFMHLEPIDLRPSVPH